MSIGWDGTYQGNPLPPGVYTYRARIAFFDGLTETFIGQVTILR